MPRRSKSARSSSAASEPTIKKTWTVTIGQENFIKRKVRELQRHVSQKESGDVTESSLIQALIQFWMESETGDFEHKLNDRIIVGQAGGESAGSS